MKHFTYAGLSILVLSGLASTFLWTNSTQPTLAHCQVPCGIYDDPARVARLGEDAATISKAVDQINLLSGQHDAQAFNQAARWVATKELHASHIIEVVSEYFLAQKVKPVARGGDGFRDYARSLMDHHAVIVAAMKTKQNSDKSFANGLVQAIEAMGAHYK